MIRRFPPATRTQAVKRVEAQMFRGSFPRLQMMLLVSLTGGFDLLAS